MTELRREVTRPKRPFKGRKPAETQGAGDRRTSNKPLDNLISAASGGQVALERQTRSLQRSHGNQHVQRLVQREGGGKVNIPAEVERAVRQIRSKTLEGVMYAIETGGEAGRGGVENMEIGAQFNAKGIATEVNITGRLFTELPVWTARDSRPAAEKAEWDRFLGVLTKHENRHLAIAQKHLRNMKSSLGGLKEEALTAAWNRHLTALNTEQEDYDTSSQNGIKEGTVINLPDSS